MSNMNKIQRALSMNKQTNYPDNFNPGSLSFAEGYNTDAIVDVVTAMVDNTKGQPISSLHNLKEQIKQVGKIQLGENLEFGSVLEKFIKKEEKRIRNNLEFSEGNGQGALDGNAVSGNPITSNTFASLGIVSEIVGSNLNPQTLAGMILPDSPVNAYEVEADIVGGVSGILPYSGHDQNIISQISPRPTAGVVYRSALWTGICTLQGALLTNIRKMGSKNFSSRGVVQQITYNSIMMKTQADTLRNVLKNNALAYNEFLWGDQNIAMGIPDENYLAISPMGTYDSSTGLCDYNNPDPYYNPIKALANIINLPHLRKYRQYIRGFIMNAGDFQNVMNYPTIQSLIQATMTAGMALPNVKRSIDQIKELGINLGHLYAPLNNIPIYPDDAVWVGQYADGTMNNDEQNYYVPTGTIYVLMDLPNIYGPIGNFLLTYNPNDGNYQGNDESGELAQTKGLYMNVAERNWNNSDGGPRINLIVSLAGAPAIYNPQNVFIISGLYSNIDSYSQMREKRRIDQALRANTQYNRGAA
jgi:hypothetical protein